MNESESELPEFPVAIETRGNNSDVHERYEALLRVRGLHKVKQTGFLDEKTYVLESHTDPKYSYKLSENQLRHLKRFQARCKKYAHRAFGPIDFKRQLRFHQIFDKYVIKELPPIEMSDVTEHIRLRDEKEKRIREKMDMQKEHLKIRRSIRIQFLESIRATLVKMSQPPSTTFAWIKMKFTKSFSWLASFAFRLELNQIESPTTTPQELPEQRIVHTYDICLSECKDIIHCGICDTDVHSCVLSDIIIPNLSCRHIFHKKCLNAYRHSDQIETSIIDELTSKIPEEYVSKETHLSDYIINCPMCPIEFESKTYDTNIRGYDLH